MEFRRGLARRREAGEDDLSDLRIPFWQSESLTSHTLSMANLPS